MYETAAFPLEKCLFSCTEKLINYINISKYVTIYCKNRNK